MTSPTTAPATRTQVVSWALWDWGSSAYNAVILTFVFSVYLTEAVGDGTPEASSWLGFAIGAAGALIALIAPVLAQRADSAGRRKRATGVWSAITIVLMAAMVLVVDAPSYLWLGLTLLALASITSELATVSYNAMLCQVSTPATIGRVSGFGWGMGYLGSIILLLAIYVGFIAGDGGALGVPTEGGLDIRLTAVVAAVWFAVFAIPLFLKVPEVPATPRGGGTGVVAAYRTLFRDLRELYRTSPHTVYFLGASALFRDGLAAVFTFGAVLAVSVYGIAAGDVLLFGVAANVVAAAGALAGGRIEDLVGPKAVIIGSLIAMIGVAGVLLVVSGPGMFWIFGLLLCLFVGPAQASSRSFLGRLAPAGHEGQLFGLYATTGRAISFLAPTLFGVFVAIFGSQRAGIGGIVVVLGVGLLALLKVASPARTSSAGNGERAVL